MDLMDILEGAGYVLDTPGSLLRGVLSGKPGERKSGRDMLEAWGALNPNTPGLDWGDVAGFGADVLVDPLNLIGGPAAWKLGGKLGNRAADAAGIGAKAVGAAPEVSQAVNRTGDLTGAMQPLRAEQSYGDLSDVMSAFAKDFPATDDEIQGWLRSPGQEVGDAAKEMPPGLPHYPRQAPARPSPTLGPDVERATLKIHEQARRVANLRDSASHIGYGPAQKERLTRDLQGVVKSLRDEMSMSGADMSQVDRVLNGLMSGQVDELTASKQLALLARSHEGFILPPDSPWAALNPEEIENIKSVKSRASQFITESYADPRMLPHAVDDLAGNMWSPLEEPILRKYFDPSDINAKKLAWYRKNKGIAGRSALRPLMIGGAVASPLALALQGGSE